MQIFDANIEPNIGTNIRYITKYTKARYVQKKIRRDLYEAFIKWCGGDSINVCIEKALRIFGANIGTNIVPNIDPNIGTNTARSSTLTSSARAFVPDIDPNIDANIVPNIGTNEAGSKASHQDPSGKLTGVSPRLADVLKQMSAEPVEVAKGDGVEVYVYEVREGA